MLQPNRSGPVLIVEDDRNTSALIKTYLEKEGFQIIQAYDGEEALSIIKNSEPSFVILDIMLPKIDGWEVCRRLRNFSDVPVLMLTAREEEIDRVLGLSLGADDYVVKPFSPRELLARVKAILRRARPVQPEKTEILSRADLVLDPEKHKVTLKDKNISLTSFEYKLLYTLMHSPGRVFSRSELLDKLYQHGEVVIDRVIDVHIGKLRQKIEPNPAKPYYIETVRGFGYRFRDNDAEKQA